MNNNPFTKSKNNRFEKNETQKYNEIHKEYKKERQPITDIRSNNEGNSFISRKKDEASKKIYYEMNISDFPDLNVDNNSETINLKKCQLDYKNASLKEVEKEGKTIQKFEPGWTYIKNDKNTNNILKKYIKKENKENNYSFEEILNYDMNNAIEEIINRRIDYIEYYGEDRYNKDYNIEKYEEMSINYLDDIDEDYGNGEEDGNYFE
jgi:hypothetical protein